MASKAKALTCGLDILIECGLKSDLDLLFLTFHHSTPPNIIIWDIRNAVESADDFKIELPAEWKLG